MPRSVRLVMIATSGMACAFALALVFGLWSTAAAAGRGELAPGALRDAVVGNTVMLALDLVCVAVALGLYRRRGWVRTTLLGFWVTVILASVIGWPAPSNGGWRLTVWALIWLVASWVWLYRTPAVRDYLASPESGSRDMASAGG